LSSISKMCGELTGQKEKPFLQKLVILKNITVPILEQFYK